MLPRSARNAIRRGIVLLLVVASSATASEVGLAAASRVSEASYRHFLDDVLYTHYGDDRGHSGPERDLARDAIAAHFTSLGLDVVLEPFPHTYGTSYNVVATKTGTDFPDQQYIIGAHYDSAGNPGADDNASGVALVMEAARVLTAFDSAYTIVFIAFDREETGTAGSHAYVDNHIGDNILGMIAADMVAYNQNGSNEAHVWAGTLFATMKVELVDAVTMYSGGLTPEPITDSYLGDWWAFEEAGFPACQFSENVLDGDPNPHYHTPLDSVDTPNYIDYTFATRMTRSVVGFLVDHAEVDVPLPEGDFNQDTIVDTADYDAFVLCYTGADNGPIDEVCQAGNFDFDADIDCDDWVEFRASWTDPGNPPQLLQCMVIDPLPGSWPHDAAKNRYVAFEPDNENLLAAFDIVLAQSGLYPEAEGLSGWVSAPNENGVSALVYEPVYLDAWPATVLVADCEIVPDSTYHIRGTVDAALFSYPLVVATTARPEPKAWGDICGPFDGVAWGPPNGTVNFDDAFAALKAYQQVPSAPHFSWADVEPQAPNITVNINDVFQLILAFQGFPYPFTNPASCP